jgi:CHAD domain-containing protein
VKARRVKGLAPAMPLAEAAERIVRVRLAELCELAQGALEPEAVETLHDCRIAAKRLRYVLEITGPIFGPEVVAAGKRCRELQDLLGDLHDCDVMLPRIDALRAEVRAGDAAMLVHLGNGAAPPRADAYRGLERLAVELTAQRRRLFHQWLEAWAALERDRYRARLERALRERVVNGL